MLILKTAELQSAGRDFDLEIVTQIVREVKEQVRARIIKGEYQGCGQGRHFQEIVRQILNALEGYEAAVLSKSD